MFSRSFAGPAVLRTAAKRVISERRGRMTRETKAGLVVSCSFLCLVGVVLYCKLNGPKPPLADAYAEGGVEAPPAPTPIGENNHSEDAVLPFGSDDVGSSTEKRASTT